MVEIAKKIAAAFAVACLGVIGAGSILGVEVWKSAAMAGIGACAVIVEKLCRAYLEDGKLTAKEVDEIFASYEKGSKK
jgi:hypothetical protein